MFAAMAMQWTVARAVAFGVIKDHLPFVRTAKGGTARKRRDRSRPSTRRSSAACWCSARSIVFATNYERVHEINLFACVLLVQSLPFLAAVALAAFERPASTTSRFWNDR